MQPIHFLNGKFVEEKDLKISVRDLGFSRGFAVFDFFITYSNKPFMMNRHIDRLLNSASLINLHVPYSKKQIHNWILQTLSKNKDGKEKTVRIMLSGGIAETVFSNRENTTIIIQIDDRHYLPKELYKAGVSIVTTKHSRYIPQSKTNNYIEAVKNMPLVTNSGAIEMVYYDDTSVLEGCTSNIFAAIEGKLVTPKSNILPGVTRDVVLEIIKSEERDFTINELRSATEVFLTSSNKEILPVTKIDGKPVGSGKVGPITKKVMIKFKKFTLK